MEEIWKDIFGYEGLYQISNLGRVKSLNYMRTRKERILKQQKDKGGYLLADLTKDNKRTHFLIHRLVALHFIPNDDLFKTEINHKDECKTNNIVFVNDDGTIDESKSNLEWCTPKENSNYGTRNEKCSKANRNHPNMSKQVQQYSKDGKTLIKTFPSLREVERQLGFSQSHISKCCKGKYKTAYGFFWRYHN